MRPAGGETRASLDRRASTRPSPAASLRRGPRRATLWFMLKRALVGVASCAMIASGACGDAARPPLDSAPGEDVADTTPPPEVVDTSCRATLTEVDAGFVEVVATGDCADWSVAIRDGASGACQLAAEVFLPRGLERVALQGFQVPERAVIILQNAQLRPMGVWTLGTCEPDAGCLGFIGAGDRPEREVCLPADTPGGTVSLCGDSWVGDKAPTPGAQNDCACAVDCQKAAGFCQTGSCVDGACAFSPRAEGEACDDHDLCTSGDRCAGGACRGEALTCGPPPGPCAEPGACSPRTGQCVYADACGDNAECTAEGCACASGYRGDGAVGCVNIDECQTGLAVCDPTARCVDTGGGYLCVCPLGYADVGGVCVESRCACPWEDPTSCGPAWAKLRVRVTDLWAQPIERASLSLVDVASGQAIRAGEVDAAGIGEPLCAARAFRVSVGAADHHGFEGTIHWLESDITLESSPSRDAAWAITWDAQGPIVWVGLAHRWFASSGRPARHGNRVDFMLDGEVAWRTVYAELQLAERLVTGTSWWWESDFEIVRPDDHLTLDPWTRWNNTILGALEDLQGVEKKILVCQFISQDGLFSDVTVDDALLEKAGAPADQFEYMGQANPAAGEWTIVPPVVDYAARVLGAHGGIGELIDEAPADAFREPIAVDTTEVPLGLSLVDLPIASWHQKFWTIDQEVAFIGGMNAKGTDWDSSEHRVFDARRMAFDAGVADRQAVERREREPDLGPRKDYMVRIEGPIVQDAVEVFAVRWQYQRDEQVEYADLTTPLWLEPTRAYFDDGVQAQVVATMPEPFDEHAILESLLRAIGQARRYIYIEDQYFRAPLLYDAIAARMSEVPGLQLVVLTNPVSEWTDPGCYQTAIAHQRFRALFPDRYRLFRLRAFDYVRTDCTFCWDETEAHFVDMDLHSKIAIVDDEYLEVGSCNSNNRGLLYEGELAVVVHDRAWVGAQRRRIFENLLGPGYDGGMPIGDIIAAFDERARANDIAYAGWENAGMDLDLDGDAVPAELLPSGLLYNHRFDPPDECLLEGVGPDVM